MKTCKTCQQEMPVALTYRDMEPREIEVAPKNKVKLSSIVLKYYFAIRNPMVKALMYPVGFLLGAITIVGGCFLTFPCPYWLGVYTASLFGINLTLVQAGPFGWLLGIVILIFCYCTYCLGKYFTKGIDRWRLLNER